MADELTVRLQETTAAFQAATAAVRTAFPSAALSALQASLIPNAIARNKAWLQAHRNEGNDNPDAIQALVDGTAKLEAVQNIATGTAQNLAELLADVERRTAEEFYDRLAWLYTPPPYVK